MNELSRSTKGESEKSATKPVRQAKNGSVAGVEHQLGNRTTRALLDSQASGRGRPLEAGVRKSMETAFHEDFSPGPRTYPGECPARRGSGGFRAAHCLPARPICASFGAGETPDCA